MIEQPMFSYCSTIIKQCFASLGKECCAKSSKGSSHGELGSQDFIHHAPNACMSEFPGCARRPLILCDGPDLPLCSLLWGTDTPCWQASRKLAWKDSKKPIVHWCSVHGPHSRYTEGSWKHLQKCIASKRLHLINYFFFIFFSNCTDLAGAQWEAFQLTVVCWWPPSSSMLPPWRPMPYA